MYYPFKNSFGCAELRIKTLPILAKSSVKAQSETLSPTLSFSGSILCTCFHFIIKLEKLFTLGMGF